MHAVVTPALLLSVRHDHQLSVDQPARQAGSAWFRIGNLPNDRFLGHVPANFDNAPDLQNVFCETHSVELDNRRTFNGPSSNLSVCVSLLQVYKAVGIDLVKLDDCSFYADSLRRVEISQRMMSSSEPAETSAKRTARDPVVIFFIRNLRKTTYSFMCSMTILRIA